MKNSMADLKATLERIRKEKYPDIPPEVIDEIVDVQSENQDDPATRYAKTKKIIDSYAKKIIS